MSLQQGSHSMLPAGLQQHIHSSVFQPSTQERAVRVSNGILLEKEKRLLPRRVKCILLRGQGQLRM